MYITRSILTTLCFSVLPSMALFAEETKITIPKITVDGSGVKIGDVKIKNDGDIIKTNPAPSRSNNVVLGGNNANSDFRGQDLQGVTFEDGDFSDANFNGANLKDASFKNSKFKNTQFRGACMENAIFDNSDFTDADFSGAIFTGFQNNGSDFDSASLEGVSEEKSCGNDVALEGGVPTQTRSEITPSDVIVTTLESGIDSKIDLTFNFNSGSDDISGKGHEQLYEIATALKAPALANNKIMIEGHTDSQGAGDYNKDLSYQRALRVKRVLIEDYDIDRSRLQIDGLGEDQPIADNETEEGRAINRRITLINLGL